MYSSPRVITKLRLSVCAKASGKDKHLQRTIQLGYHSQLSSDEINLHSEMPTSVFMNSSRSLTVSLD